MIESLIVKVHFMNMRMIFPFVLLLAWVSGCSSISVPSMPWSHANKADPTAEALYDEGMRNFNEKRYVRALDNFSKLRTDYPFSPQITQIELKVADAYYLNQQFPEAINAFKEFQSMHPTNENIPFVILRLGQAHFDQFTSTDRDQKNTEIAKGYFENVIASYPNSPQAAEAKDKLAKCLEYLAEHEFNVAYFYFKQEKYPAARDRFEEIVRKYKGTPTAVKSLFYLGESYRIEKNAIRATLAYEALIQHYPQTKFAADARIQLAQVEKEKQDPLALLLMRDRRSSVGPATEVKEDPALAKLKDLNLIAKTEVVHEEPGDEKGFFSRVAGKLNPFSSSSSPKKEEKIEPSALDLLAKRNQAQKKKEEESSGILASLWPFGSKDSKPSTASSDPKANNFISQIDDSLKQKGIDSAPDRTALKPPAADLPNTDDLAAKPPQTTDTATLLSSVDANLKRSGKNGADELPTPPEAAAGFKDLAVIQAATAKAPQNQPSQDVQTSGILSSIDQKLKAQGLEPAKFEKPPTTEEVKTAAAQKPQPKNVELEPKFALEKGPLYLSPAEVESQEKPAAKEETKKIDNVDGSREIPSRVLVKGPVDPQSAAARTKSPATKQASAAQDDEPKGVFDQIRQDVESVSKVLNPFSW
jgi:outer membrane protein assembly factor BamD